MQLAHLKAYAGLTLFLCGATLLGCGSSQAPQELVDARAAYMRADDPLTRQFDPASLHEARVALDQAESAYRDDGQSQRVKDMSYIAIRKAQIAQARAMTNHVHDEIADAKRAAMQQSAKQADKNEAALEQTRQQLEQARRARAAAEQRAQDAQNALDKLAAIHNAQVTRDETRGTVISFPATLLFASGGSRLKTSAQSTLSDVADALKQQDHAQVEIRSYTDSAGHYQANMQLAQQRADALEDYLASQGVSRDVMTAKGYAPAQPTAANSTASEHASQRRAEIVVRPEQQQPQPQQRTQQQ